MPSGRGRTLPQGERPEIASPCRLSRGRSPTLDHGDRGWGAGTGFHRGPGSIIARTLVAKASIAKGLVIIRIPGARWPLPKAAFSA